MAHANRSYNVTELRGLACFLLVAYHVVGVPGSGMQVGEDSLYRYATSSFELIRMPLFTFISGFVYALRPVREGALGRFLGKKLRRLAVPFLIVSTVYFLFQSLTPGTNAGDVPGEMWRIYLFPYAHLWYLQALLLIFGAVGLLDSAGLINRPLPFAAAMALAVALCLGVETEVNPLSINEAATLLPHFLLGVAVRRFASLFADRRVGMAALGGLAVGVAIHQATLLHLLDQHIGWKSGVALLCGTCGAVTLLRVMPPGALFRRIGNASYAIYLYHTFFTAATRLILNRLGAHELAVFCLSLAMGIAGPMLLEAAALLRPWSRTALVGRA